jgi:enoyl-CoA hydratase/carnithine racemase
MELRSLHWAAQEMGDALTDALDGFAGDANVRVVVVTGGAPDY